MKATLKISVENRYIPGAWLTADAHDGGVLLIVARRAS